MPGNAQMRMLSLAAVIWMGVVEGSVRAQDRIGRCTILDRSARKVTSAQLRSPGIKKPLVSSITDPSLLTPGFRARRRDDFIQRYSLGLERRFVLKPGREANRRTRTIDRVVMTIRGDIQFTDDDSNIRDRLGQDIFQYDRAVYGLSVSFAARPGFSTNRRSRPRL